MARPLPLLLILVAIVIRYVGPVFTALQKSTDDLNLVVQEDLNAIRVVKSFVREDREQEQGALGEDLEASEVSRISLKVYLEGDSAPRGADREGMDLKREKIYATG